MNTKQFFLQISNPITYSKGNSSFISSASSPMVNLICCCCCCC